MTALFERIERIERIVGRVAPLATVRAQLLDAAAGCLGIAAIVSTLALPRPVLAATANMYEYWNGRETKGAVVYRASRGERNDLRLFSNTENYVVLTDATVSIAGGTGFLMRFGCSNLSGSPREVYCSHPAGIGRVEVWLGDSDDKFVVQTVLNVNQFLEVHGEDGGDQLQVRDAVPRASSIDCGNGYDSIVVDSDLDRTVDCEAVTKAPIRVQLKARHSGKCVDVRGASTADQAVIQQWTCLGAQQFNQLWTLVPVGDTGAFQIQSFAGKCLDVTGVSHANGAPIQQYRCLGAAQQNQLWVVMPVPATSGWYNEIVSLESGKCLDVAELSQADGGRLQQWDCLGPAQPNQLFSIFFP